ncbi:MAG: electron transfer flavoprotein subunit alpha/FixB family protein [Candidatus Poribacteria bacterium]
MEKKDINEYKGLWIYAEQRDGILMNVALELLGAGRGLADILNVPLSALLLGNRTDEIAKQLIHFGADQVYVIDHPLLKQYEANLYTKAIVSAIEKYCPEILLFGATFIGRELAPRLATRLRIGLSADCTELAIDQENRLLVQTKPAFGGNVMAKIIIPNHRPQIATVRPNVMKRLEPQMSRTGQIIRIDDVSLQAEDILTKVIDIVKDTESSVNLQEAKIIVAGGFGLGKAENFRLIKELADVLGGAVGASRAVVDADWISSYHLIGQTGKTVQPKLYIACGISGCIQHIVGMQSSEVIIAINKDPSAPIFNIATYGIVGDLTEIVPAITKIFKEKLGK